LKHGKSTSETSPPESALSTEAWDANRPQPTPPGPEPQGLQGFFAPQVAPGQGGPAHPAYPGQQTYPGEQAHPGQQAYPGEQAYPGQPDQPGAGPGMEPPSGPGGPDGEPPKPGRRRRRRNVLIAIGLFVVLVAGGLAGLFFERQSALDNNINRIPQAFPTSANRPAGAPAGVENWLLIGSDTRAQGLQPGQTTYGGQRSDTIMLVHLPKDRKAAYMVSIPRDSWVTIPGHGKAKINAAFSWGGSALLIDTIEKLTNVRIDHFAILDFEGMKTMTDALGGVDVRVSSTITDAGHGQTWRQGINHLDGEKALLFVRQRHGLAGGDFDRIKRQQAFLKALANKAVSKGTLTNPLKLNSFLEALTKSVSVDDTVKIGDLRSLAFGSRNMRPGDITFMTAPNRGPGRAGSQSIVRLDLAKCGLLFAAIRQDTVADYLKDKTDTTNKIDSVH
jgi:LCP family protein required for cell wall assembly